MFCIGGWPVATVRCTSIATAPRNTAEYARAHGPPGPRPCRSAGARRDLPTANHAGMRILKLLERALVYPPAVLDERMVDGNRDVLAMRLPGGVHGPDDAPACVLPHSAGIRPAVYREVDELEVEPALRAPLGHAPRLPRPKAQIPVARALKSVVRPPAQHEREAEVQRKKRNAPPDANGGEEAQQGQRGDDADRRVVPHEVKRPLRPGAGERDGRHGRRDKGPCRKRGPAAGRSPFLRLGETVLTYHA